MSTFQEIYKWFDNQNRRKRHDDEKQSYDVLSKNTKKVKQEITMQVSTLLNIVNYRIIIVYYDACTS